MEEKSCCYALVTGASAGLGRAISEELAARKFNLVLTALPETGLPDLCRDLEDRFSIIVHCIEADMTDMGTPARIRSFTGEHGIKITALINNVGVGFNGGIGTYSAEVINKMLMLNMVAATSMTNLFIEDLKSFSQSYILNVGSFAGFHQLPFKSIYSASKSYIYNLSLSLREELKKSGVSVSVAMPGGILTNEVVIKRIKDHGSKSVAIALTPEKAAKIIIAGMFRKKAVIIPGWVFSWLFVMSRFMPYGIIQRIMKKTFDRPD